DDITGIETLYPGGRSNTPPTAPTTLAVATNPANPSASLILTWVNTATNADGYRVDRSPDGVSFTTIVELSGAPAQYVDTGLSAATTYYYRVWAFNGAGSSGSSNVANGQTQSSSTPPAVPSNPSPATGSTNVATSLTLSWSCSNAESYDVYLWTGTNPVLY